MSQLDLGKVRPTFGGDWVSTEAYEAVTIVMHNGIAFQSLIDVPAGNEPREAGDQYWFPIAWRGEPGEDGSSTDYDDWLTELDTRMDAVETTLTRVETIAMNNAASIDELSESIGDISTALTAILG